jgi:DNA-binding transcriptional regulator GbsR (MarR family)
MHPLTEPEAIVVETMGDLMKFWGFSKHHGRIWALLYLREEPLNSPQLQDLLDMSAGLVSMSLKELQHWSVVDKQWIRGDRKDYYTANVDVWNMVTRVLREREYQLLEQSIHNLDEAMGDLETSHADPELSEDRVEYMKPRVERLQLLLESATRMLDTLLKQAEADLQDLRDTIANLPD